MNLPLRKKFKLNLVATLLCLLSLSKSTLSAQELSRPLFNGKDLAGWQQAGPGRFLVKGGMIKTEGGMGIL